MTFLKKNFLYVVLIVAASGTALYYMTRTPSADSTITQAGTPTTHTEAMLLGFSSELESVAFDATIFSDPRFVVLQDISTNIVDESAGRRDPFAPLSGVVSGPEQSP